MPPRRRANANANANTRKLNRQLQTAVVANDERNVRKAVERGAQVNALMEKGAEARTIAATNMNASSSRAHTIFSIVVTQVQTLAQLFQPRLRHGLRQRDPVGLGAMVAG